MRSLMLFVCMLVVSTPASARVISGVQIPESVTGANGVQLHLNGAGIRSKFFFSIYIAEFYLQHPAGKVAEVLADAGEKQMVMHFLYHEVGKEKLVEAWQEGFEANLDKAQYLALSGRIKAFNAMFATVKKGDEIVLDYIPGTGTRVSVAGKRKGVIEGKDFADGLWSIWLGKKPVSSDLKQQLLGAGDN